MHRLIVCLSLFKDILAIKKISLQNFLKMYNGQPSCFSLQICFTFFQLIFGTAFKKRPLNRRINHAIIDDQGNKPSQVWPIFEIKSFFSKKEKFVKRPTAPSPPKEKKRKKNCKL